MSKEPLGDKLDDFRAQYRAEQAGLRQRIAALERQNAELAAAYIADTQCSACGGEKVLADDCRCRYDSPDDRPNPNCPHCGGPGIVEFDCPVCEGLGHVRKSESQAAAILTARLLDEREKGGREALEELNQMGSLYYWIKMGIDMNRLIATWTPRERRGGEVTCPD